MSVIGPAEVSLPARCDDPRMARRTRASAPLAELIDGYSRRIYTAVLAQEAGSVVCSPLGVWLLLAACAVGARGENRSALEQTIGCSANDGLEKLNAFISRPPAALKAAIACWVSVEDASEAVAEWVRRLPSEVESGYMPTKTQADAWADRNTLGLIKEFPIVIDPDTRMALASALATRVSWRAPFAVARADDGLRAGSPWRGTVERVLWDQRPGRLVMIGDTPRAGRVAVHVAVASEELTVLSVSADPCVDREAVLDAAHQVAALMRGASSSARQVSLFELECGEGHSWSLDEREVATDRPGERREKISDAYMPAWNLDSKLDLLSSATFGCQPALATLRELIGPRPSDRSRAAQAAVASFTRYGFKAAAITAVGFVSAAGIAAEHSGVERTAVLRFDHPYAVIAVAGQLDGQHDDSEFFALPVFSAWVAAPHEAQAET
jgi:Serpin (serine protease inhibitor)